MFVGEFVLKAPLAIQEMQEIGLESRFVHSIVFAKTTTCLDAQNRLKKKALVKYQIQQLLQGNCSTRRKTGNLPVRIPGRCLRKARLAAKRKHETKMAKRMLLEALSS